MDTTILGYKEEDIPTIKQLAWTLHNKKHLMTDSQREALWTMYNKLKDGDYPTGQMMDYWERIKTANKVAEINGDTETTKDVRIKELEHRVEELEHRQRTLEREVEETMAAIYDAILKARGQL